MTTTELRISCKDAKTALMGLKTLVLAWLEPMFGSRRLSSLDHSGHSQSTRVSGRMTGMWRARMALQCIQITRLTYLRVCPLSGTV